MAPNSLKQEAINVEICHRWLKSWLAGDDAIFRMKMWRSLATNFKLQIIKFFNKAINKILVNLLVSRGMYFYCFAFNIDNT